MGGAHPSDGESDEFDDMGDGEGGGGNNHTEDRKLEAEVEAGTKGDEGDEDGDHARAGDVVGGEEAPVVRHEGIHEGEAGAPQESKGGSFGDDGFGLEDVAEHDEIELGEVGDEHERSESAADLGAEEGEEAFASELVEGDNGFGEGEREGSEEPDDGSGDLPGGHGDDGFGGLVEGAGHEHGGGEHEHRAGGEGEVEFEESGNCEFGVHAGS